MVAFPAFFQDLKDPRSAPLVGHSLRTVVAIVLLSILCGAQGWDDMYLWAYGRQRWLSTFLDLSNGVPSADTIRRVVSGLDPKAFRQGFAAWSASLVTKMPRLHLAVDGTTLRGSARLGLTAAHLVRAFVVGNQLVLGQLATEAKSNEITAIPELLETLAIRGGLVTIDARGAQHKIAEKILEKGADYLFAVKDNQPSLRAELEAHLGARQAPARASAHFAESEEEGHGRIERRRVWTETKLASLGACQPWPQAAMIARVESLRTAEGKTSVEDRFYLCSRSMTAKEVSAAIRGHWAVENVCHWSLDVTLGEDASRSTAGYAAANLSLVRRVVLAALKRSPETLANYGNKKLSMRQKQKVCGWDNEALLEVLGALF